MSDLYRIKVVATKDAITTLDVRIAHPDAGMLRNVGDRDSKSFALMLLQESSKPGDPLRSEISYREASDKKWVKKYANGFIRAVEIVEMTNAPPPAALKNEDHQYWRDFEEGEVERMRVRLKITATHPAWVKHLKKGAGWESAAYAMTVKLDACPPAAPRS